MFKYFLILALGLFLAGLSAIGNLTFGAAYDPWWSQVLTTSFEQTRIYLVSLFVAWASIYGLSGFAEKFKLIDMPDNNRKVHSEGKPLVGGLGIVAGVLVAMLLFFPVIKYMSLIISILLILGIGVIDDRFDISFKWRFVVQITATVIVMNYFPGMHLQTFGNILGFGAIGTGWLVVPVTIFCTLGVINALNMIDGLDGLAGTTSLLAFITFGVLAWLNGMPSFMFPGIAFAGALAAFLRFNWHPSRLFMGDAGSMTIGFVLAFLAIELSQKPGGIVTPVTVLLVLAIPVTDTLAVMIKRIMKGKSPFLPDKTHFHHLLRDMGFGHSGSVMIIMTISLLFSLVAIGATVLRVQDIYLFGLFVSWFVFYFRSSQTMGGLFSIIEWLRRHSMSKPASILHV